MSRSIWLPEFDGAHSVTDHDGGTLPYSRAWRQEDDLVEIYNPLYILILRLNQQSQKKFARLIKRV